MQLLFELGELFLAVPVLLVVTNHASPPLSQFHREHTPLVALSVSLEESQEGLTGSQLCSRSWEEIDPETSLGFSSVGRTRREDRSQAPQILGGDVVRQIIATVYVVRAILLRHEATVQIDADHITGRYQLKSLFQPLEYLPSLTATTHLLLEFLQVRPVDTRWQQPLIREPLYHLDQYTTLLLYTA